MEQVERRVDILIKKDVLRWAAIEAAKRGMSRRRFIAYCVEYTKKAMSDSEEDTKLRRV